MKPIDQMTAGKHSQNIRDRVCNGCTSNVVDYEFRDDLSRAEYEISGYCMACQDEVFDKDSLLTLDQLKSMESGQHFKGGKGLIVHPWFNQAKHNLVDGRYVEVKWVAVRGGIHDWAIYHSLDANLERSEWLDGFNHLNASFEAIARHGAKVYDRKIVRKFVPCNDEALKMYRD